MELAKPKLDTTYVALVIALSTSAVFATNSLYLFALYLDPIHLWLLIPAALSLGLATVLKTHCDIGPNTKTTFVLLMASILVCAVPIITIDAIKKIDNTKETTIQEDAINYQDNFWWHLKGYGRPNDDIDPTKSSLFDIEVFSFNQGPNRDLHELVDEWRYGFRLIIKFGIAMTYITTTLALLSKQKNRRVLGITLCFINTLVCLILAFLFKQKGMMATLIIASICLTYAAWRLQKFIPKEKDLEYICLAISIASFALFIKNTEYFVEWMIHWKGYWGDLWQLLPAALSLFIACVFAKYCTRPIKTDTLWRGLIAICIISGIVILTKTLFINLPTYSEILKDYAGSASSDSINPIGHMYEIGPIYHLLEYYNDWQYGVRIIVRFMMSLSVVWAGITIWQKQEKIGIAFSAIAGFICGFFMLIPDLIRTLDIIPYDIICTILALLLINWMQKRKAKKQKASTEPESDLPSQSLPTPEKNC